MLMTAALHDIGVWAEGEFELAEGARWVDGRLAFVNILAGELLEAPGDAPGPPRVLARLGVPVGAAAPVHGRPGHWILAAGTGITLLAPDGQLHWLATPEADAPVPTRMNDAACDPAGRFWAGSMAYDATEGAGSLYRADPDGAVHRVLTGLTIVNGPAFSPDGSQLYVADTAAGTIYRCAVSRAGELSGPDVFARVPPEAGAPDGMAVDSDGCLWAALWGGSAVCRYHPDGRLLTTIGLPAAQPSSVCLAPSGGRLLVTTARHGLDGAAPPAGSVLYVRVPATAPPACAYRPGPAPA
jgi:sugar lactone lactonase YvrE